MDLLKRYHDNNQRIQEIENKLRLINFKKTGKVYLEYDNPNFSTGIKLPPIKNKEEEARKI